MSAKMKDDPESRLARRPIVVVIISAIIVLVAAGNFIGHYTVRISSRTRCNHIESVSRKRIRTGALRARTHSSSAQSTVRMLISHLSRTGVGQIIPACDDSHL